jgi:hypothetical protein
MYKQQHGFWGPWSTDAESLDWEAEAKAEFLRENPEWQACDVYARREGNVVWVTNYVGDLQGTYYIPSEVTA